MSSTAKSIKIMATTKAFLDTRRVRQDGTYPIKIRVAKDRKAFLHSLNVFLKANDWDDELRRVKYSHPEAKQLNQTIIQEELRIQRLIYDLQLQHAGYSIADIKCVVQGKKKVVEDCLLRFGYQQVEQMTAAGRFGNAHAYKYALLKLERYPLKPV
jgi:integrase/recombinase XerD